MRPIFKGGIILAPVTVMLTLTTGALSEDIAPYIHAVTEAIKKDMVLSYACGPYIGTSYYQAAMTLGAGALVSVGVNSDDATIEIANFGEQIKTGVKNQPPDWPFSAEQTSRTIRTGVCQTVVNDAEHELTVAAAKARKALGVSH